MMNSAEKEIGKLLSMIVNIDPDQPTRVCLSVMLVCVGEQGKRQVIKCAGVRDLRVLLLESGAMSDCYMYCDDISADGLEDINWRIADSEESCLMYVCREVVFE
jgi:hypothetical protein